MRNTAILLLVALTGCSIVPAQLSDVTRTPEYESATKAWIRCNFTEAERYVSVEPDANTIATAVAAACSPHRAAITTMFLEKDVFPSRFNPLIDRMSQSNRETVVLYVIGRRAGRLRPYD